MSFSRFSAILASTVCVSVAILRLALSVGAWRAALLGALLAALNAEVAYGLVSWSSKRSTLVFFQAILGGTLARMTLLLGGVLVALLGLGLPRGPFLGSLLSYFVLFLALEMVAVHKAPPEGRPAGGP